MLRELDPGDPDESEGVVGLESQRGLERDHRRPVQGRIGGLADALGKGEAEVALRGGV